MQQLYRRAPISKCDFSKDANFIEITLWHGCSLVNLLHIFRTPLPKSTSGWLLLILTLCIQNPAKHLRWSLLRKWLIVFRCLTGLGNYMFKVRNENIRSNPLSADPGKWSNTLKQFVNNLDVRKFALIFSFSRKASCFN